MLTHRGVSKVEQRKEAARMDQRMSLQQALARIEQLETTTGMLFVALSKFSSPRQWYHRGGQIVYLVTEQEQQEARRARMYALRVMADAGVTLPVIAFGVPTVPLWPSRPSNGPQTSPFTRGLDIPTDPHDPRNHH